MNEDNSTSHPPMDDARRIEAAERVLIQLGWKLRHFKDAWQWTFPVPGESDVMGVSAHEENRDQAVMTGFELAIEVFARRDVKFGLQLALLMAREQAVAMKEAVFEQAAAVALPTTPNQDIGSHQWLKGLLTKYGNGPVERPAGAAG